MTAPVVLSDEEMAAIEARAEKAPSPRAMTEAMLKSLPHPEGVGGLEQWWYEHGVAHERERAGADVPCILAALRHALDVAEAERALRMACASQRMNARGISMRSLAASAAVVAAEEKLRALGRLP